MTNALESQGSSLGFAPWAGGGLGVCFGIALFLYNVIALVQVLRAPEKPSAISMVAWALAFVSVFIPTCGFFLAIVAFIMGRVENNRIFTEKSPVASSRPVEMATINSLLAMVFTVVFTAMAIAAFW